MGEKKKVDTLFARTSPESSGFLEDFNFSERFYFLCGFFDLSHAEAKRLSIYSFEMLISGAIYSKRGRFNEEVRIAQGQALMILNAFTKKNFSSHIDKLFKNPYL